MSWSLSVAVALSVIARLVSFAVLTSSLELVYLAGKGEFSEGGAWDWNILKSVSAPRSQYIDGLMKGQHSFIALLFIRCSAAFLLAALGIHSRVSPEILSILLVCQFILNNRLIWGDDGSDQMISLIVVALFLYSIAGSRLDIGTMAILFISAQLTLAYVSAGIAKLCGSEWRRGVAFRNIMGHHTYGNRYCYDLLTRYPLAGRLASYSVILFMVTFPVYFLVPAPWAAVYLIVGFAFHAGIGAVMRLNGFLTAFASGYPALVVAHYLVRHAISG